LTQLKNVLEVSPLCMNLSFDFVKIYGIYIRGFPSAFGDRLLLTDKIPATGNTDW